jgi:hypothetical protein
MTPPETPSKSHRRAFGLIGHVVALLIAIMCVLFTAWCLYDIAYLAHSPNDWGDPAVIDVAFATIVSVTGFVIALSLAIFARPFFRFLAIPTFALAAVEVFLWFQLPRAFAMNKERQQSKVDAMVREMERVGRAAKPARN